MQSSFSLLDLNKYLKSLALSTHIDLIRFCAKERDELIFLKQGTRLLCRVYERDSCLSPTSVNEFNSLLCPASCYWKFMCVLAWVVRPPYVVVNKKDVVWNINDDKVCRLLQSKVTEKPVCNFQQDLKKRTPTDLAKLS